MKRLFVSVTLLLFAAGSQAEVRTSCGGDGPQPFTTKGPLKLKFTKLSTKGSVRDFVYHPRSGGIFYRNQSRWAYSLFPAFHQMFDFVPRDLSPVLGNWDHLQLSHTSGEETASIIDLRLGRSYVTAVPKDAKPLFWMGRLLFWTIEKQHSAIRWGMDIHYQMPQSRHTQHICSVHWPANEQYHLASGSQYPHVLLYHTTPAVAGPGEQLAFYQVDVRKCQVTGLKAYKDPTSGPVQSVHYFHNPGGWAVQMDHPQNNLLWDNGTQCRYYNLGNQAVIPITTDEPVVATWSGRDGLTFWGLDAQQKMAVLPPGFDPVEPRDIAYDSRSQDLFLRAAPYGTGDHRIIHTDLGALFR